MSRPRIYIETTVVSYLTARPSRDLIVAAHQQVTSMWWSRFRDEFDCYVSELVIQEASAGDTEAAAHRLETIRGIPSLGLSEDVLHLAEDLVAQGAIPRGAAEDALHVAVAAMNGMDYLVTWNCRHIANARMRIEIAEVCLAAGCEAPVICTPEELTEE
jgi:predicted nucleic acid-binding protein